MAIFDTVNMGSKQSKTEEIVIAQNGANDVDYSSIEQKLERHGMIVTTTIIIIMLVIGFVIYKKCRNVTGKWIRNQVVLPTTLAQAVQAGQQVPQHQTAHF